MSLWQKNATIWINDPDKGSVIIGAFGFAWWDGDKVFVASFDAKRETFYASYRRYKHWDSVKEYDRKSARLSAIKRFVKTGLLPS